jgi:hypothetical protein
MMLEGFVIGEVLCRGPPMTLGNLSSERILRLVLGDLIELVRDSKAGPVSWQTMLEVLTGGHNDGFVERLSFPPHRLLLLEKICKHPIRDPPMRSKTSYLISYLTEIISK